MDDVNLVHHVDVRADKLCANCIFLGLIGDTHEGFIERVTVDKFHHQNRWARVLEYGFGDTD